MKHTILFQPDSIRIEVEENMVISDALKLAGIKLQLPCAGTGKCGKCTVENTSRSAGTESIRP